MGRVLDVILDNRVKTLREQVEKFADESMKEYLNNCQAYCQNMALNASHTKNFYDSVWGTVEINEGEILILDSPLLQRLRHIKQLGLADLLYSSADHSRFSHTLGVLQTADSMAQQIEKELKKKNVITSKETRQIIRLSAIFHDSGHMFASHASERYFQKNRESTLYETVLNARNCFKMNLGIEKPSLSEIISALFVNSQAVRSLLDIVQRGLEDFKFDKVNQDTIIEQIICFIIGFPYSGELIPYAQVICGRIDSDKLDYLKRDSHSTGVPVAVDMSRVFQKLRVVESKKERKMLAVGSGTEQSVYKMAIAPAAINTVDQLIISRFVMFENIYYHQKTLTAEETLRYALLKTDQSTHGILDDFSRVLQLTDDVVVHKNFREAVQAVIGQFDIVDREGFDKACEILADLCQRKLFKRCVAFTNSNLTKGIQKEREFYSRVISGEIIQEQKFFMDTVIREVKNIKKILDTKIFYFNTNTDVLLLIAPDISAESLKSNIAIADKTNKDRDMVFESDNWLRSRASQKAQSYLVSYPEDRYIVYVATEIILLREYGLLINDTIIYSEEDEKYINQIKNFLDKKGYFGELYVLSPNQIFMSHKGEMKELVEKWQIYEMFDKETGKGRRVDQTYLLTHLRQYTRYSKKLGDFGIVLKGYFEMLGQVRIISKDSIIRALKKNLKTVMTQENCEQNKIEVCNIGNVQDSSAVLAYHMNMVNICLKTSWKACILEEVLERAEENQIIVFLEDAFCSGKQILSIFETYMGIPLEQRQTREEHVKELTDDNKEKLSRCRLYFSFIFYEKDNEAFFYNRLREIGLEQVKVIAAEAFPDGYFKDKSVEKLTEEKNIVKKYLLEAGKELIACKATDRDGRCKASWDEKRMEQSYLGYNNAQQLVAFSWNTPTYTMTPLWMNADTETFKWIPLFPRIDK